MFFFSLLFLKATSLFLNRLSFQKLVIDKAKGFFVILIFSFSEWLRSL